MKTHQYLDASDEFEDTEFDLKGLLLKIKKRWVLILSVALVVLLVTVVGIFITVPIYTSSSNVLIERNRGKSGLESNYYYYEPDFLETQSEIIRSENVALKVVDILKLATTYRRHFFMSDEGGESAFTILGILKKKVTEISYFVSSLMDEKSDEDIVPSEVSTNIEAKSDEEIIANIIRSGLTVKPVNNTKIVQISFSYKDPLIAKLVADAVVKAYMDEMLDIKLSSSSYSLKWMTEKAAEERDKLERSEIELQAFMRNNDLVTVENRLTGLPQKLSDFSRQMSNAESEKNEIQDLLVQINAVKTNPEKLEKFSIFASDTGLQSIRERVYKAKQNIEELSKKYGPKHPAMIKAKDELRILGQERIFEIKRIVSMTENSYELATSREKSLHDLVAITKGEMLNLNEKFMQYSIMKRTVDSNRVLYDTLQTSIKKQGFTEQSQSVSIWVVNKAAIPIIPSKPNKRRGVILGVMLGLFSGLGLAFLVDYLDNTLTSVRQIEEQFGLTVLGSIAELKGKENNIDSYVLFNPLSPIAESYRLIRSALLLTTADHPPKVTLVTSMSKSEGKTATVTNLARMLAMDNKSVIIVDCDLRRPRMHSLLGMSNENGLSSYLAGGIDKCVTRVIPNEKIHLIPSGPIPPDPSELLGSIKMKKLIEDLASQYDFVFLDSPPIGAVTDSLTLSQYVDGTILVAQAGKTTVEVFEGGVRKMHEINARILGVVLNNVKIQDKNSYHYGYSAYYAKDED